ncbi:hypothetical protein Patl1_07463 [Pistacia atlantica]|uniref:Uncharacterized protein n=1 Tax=Pistacia atlantica TaxID=434234 RepID=A0ACC1AE30_9ROSI|nr:hypothetical protein Patl1_07463 [Pistacia atlantica]
MKKELYCSAKAFSKMINLRLLKINNVQLPEGLEYLPNELRLFDWHGCPLKSLPSNFRLDNVATLNFSFSPIRIPWKGTQLFNTVRSISFKDCQYLNKTPDFTQAVNLEEVILKGCRRLRQIHPSLLIHKNIALLDMTLCTSLTTLPENIHMESLKKVQLSSCSKLKKFLKIVGSMDCLSELALDKTAIKELPLSVELLAGLTRFNLDDCKNLVSLPITMNGLKSLVSLTLSGCSKHENLPETLGELKRLRVLNVSGTAIRKPVSSIFLINKLHELIFCGCKVPPSNSLASHQFTSLMPRKSSDATAFRLPSLSGQCATLAYMVLNDCNLEDESILSDFFSSFSSLHLLDLSANNFVPLPEGLNYLSKLHTLYLVDSKRLQSLPELPSNIQLVDVSGCTSLETLSNTLRLCNSNLSNISCGNCLKLTGCTNMAFSMLKEHLNKVSLLFSVYLSPSVFERLFNSMTFLFLIFFSFFCVQKAPNLRERSDIHEIVLRNDTVLKFFNGLVIKVRVVQ